MEKNSKTVNTKCQIFTPKNYVKNLLDAVGYNENIIGKTILENSCGDGNILVEVVKRYINEGMALNYTKEEIGIGLSKNIYGFEIDPIQYEKCIHNLNKVVSEKGIPNLEWKIYNKDYLKDKSNIKFDFIIGNPPYISYKEITPEDKKFIKENYSTCRHGKFDYCYAFIEHSMNSLSKTGKMSYLIPSSIFKTVFGYNLREYIKPYIYEIKDYTKERIFNNALIKSAIIVIDNSYTKDSFNYFDISRNTSVSVLKNNLKNKWFFSDEFNVGNNRFGDYFKVSHVVATLLNKAYVIKEKEYKELSNYYQVQGINIEKEIVKDAATPRTKRYKKNEKIIFPYKYLNGEVVKFSENEFKRRYPGAVKYLSKFKRQLDERKSDKSAKWFEYGRSQALSSLNCKKLLISTIITEEVAIYELEENCIPYGGMYIYMRQKKQKYDLDYAKVILNSEEFLDYIKKVGINVSGNSLRITSKDIEEYRF